MLARGIIRPIGVLIASITALAAAGRGEVAAQVRGIPVYAPWVLEGGGVAADYAATGIRSGQRLEAWPIALTGEVRLGRWTLSATASEYRPTSGASSAGFGGTGSWQAGMEDFGYLQAGFGYSASEGVKVIHVPVGAGLPMTACIANDYFYPWASPRLDILHVSASLRNSYTDLRFGYSGGLHIELHNRFGFQVAVDGLIQRPNPLTIGIGMHYALGKSLLRAEQLRHASCHPF